ncbi:MAG: FTR1 family protein [bacterium]
MSFKTKKQQLLYGLIFSPLFIAITFLFSRFTMNDNPEEQSTLAPVMAQSSQVEPQRLIFLLQYIGIDYGGAVSDHKVVDKYEFHEMQEFAETVIEWYSQLRPDNIGKPTSLKLQKLLQSINEKEDLAVINSAANSLIQDLSKELGVVPYPTSTPDLSRGKFYYNHACAPCHGSSGDGLGQVAKELKPRPNSFQEFEYMSSATPYQFYNAMTYGVEGTSMPSYQDGLTDQQRWDTAFYLMTLRKGFSPDRPDRDYKLYGMELSIQTNKELIQYIKSQHSSELQTSADSSHWLSLVDYIRQNPPELKPSERLFYTEQKLNNSFAAYESGQPVQAIQFCLDAYLKGIEPIEPHIFQRESALVTKIEKEFGAYRRSLKLGEPLTQVEKRYRELQKSLVDVHAAIEPSRANWGITFIQSLTIILREGLEATLLIALMITYLVSSGYERLQRHVVMGSLCGVLSGILVWLATKFFWTISPFQQEAMEGMTSLLAAAVLFAVSFWIIQKADLKKWKTFIRTKAEKAVGTGSSFALAFAAFLAVFREAFETVLFYQVLWLKSGGVQSSVFLGFLLGVIALAIFVYFILKIGMRLPLKPFFTVSGILLGLLAFMFAGHGVRELQNIGMLNETLLPWNFNWDLFAVHATFEGLALQFGILFSFLFAWFTGLAQKLRLARGMDLDPAPAK